MGTGASLKCVGKVGWAAVENLLPGLLWSVEVQWSRAQASVTERMSQSFSTDQTLIVFSWQIVESPGKNQAVELLVKAGVGNLPTDPPVDIGILG